MANAMVAMLSASAGEKKASTAEKKKSRWNPFGGITDAILDTKEDFQSTANDHIDAVANLTYDVKETKNVISEATEEIGKTREMVQTMVAMLFNKEEELERIDSKGALEAIAQNKPYHPFVMLSETQNYKCDRMKQSVLDWQPGGREYEELNQSMTEAREGGFTKSGLSSEQVEATMFGETRLGNEKGQQWLLNQGKENAESWYVGQCMGMVYVYSDGRTSDCVPHCKREESVEAVTETQTVSVTTAKVLERTISDEDAARVINAMDAEQRGTYDMLPPELQGQVLAMIAQKMPEGE
jgi:hypothetical protein